MGSTPNPIIHIMLATRYLNAHLLSINDKISACALSEIQQALRQTQELSKRIPSYEDVFDAKSTRYINPEDLFNHRTHEKDPNKKFPRRILALGRAGIGKSTLCKLIVHKWAQGKLWPQFR